MSRPSGPFLRALVRRAVALLVAGVVACARAADPPAPEPLAAPPVAASPRVDTVTVTVPDSGLQQRVRDLELQVIARDAQIERLEASLEDARREVVRSLARLQTTASRAEAASALAEADIAVQALANRNGQAPELAQARRLLEMSAGEFSKQNYGGALYLATQVKGLATTGSGRFGGGSGSGPQPGEAPFPVPVPLRAITRANVREGPGTDRRILFTVDRGTVLTGHSYIADWVRVSDASGRSGWIYANLVGRRDGAG